MSVELHGVTKSRWFPRLCLSSYYGFGIWKFNSAFQEGLVAASQPITVNCSVYDGSCDYQIIYEAHAVPHMNITHSYIKIASHALLYVCTTFSQLILL